VNSAPVFIRYCKPLAVSRTDVDIDGTEVQVFLMTYNANRRFHFNARTVNTGNDQNEAVKGKCWAVDRIASEMGVK
jgi:molybdenum cofactor biosynthesis enzyme